MFTIVCLIHWKFSCVTKHPIEELLSICKTFWKTENFYGVWNEIENSKSCIKEYVEHWRCVYCTVSNLLCFVKWVFNAQLLTFRHWYRDKIMYNVHLILHHSHSLWMLKITLGPVTQYFYLSRHIGSEIQRYNPIKNNWFTCLRTRLTKTKFQIKTWAKYNSTLLFTRRLIFTSGLKTDIEQAHISLYCWWYSQWDYSTCWFRLLFSKSTKHLYHNIFTKN